MKQKIIPILYLWLFTACLSLPSQAQAPALIAPTASRLVAKTALETLTGLVFEDAYHVLLQKLAAAGPSAGLSDFAVHLNGYSEVHHRLFSSIRQTETKSIVNNPITGSLSYFRMLNVGYTNAGMPSRVSYDASPFDFHVRNLSESCTLATTGFNYRREISTTLFAKHSYAKPPTTQASGYVVSIGMTHTPVPSLAPCIIGVPSPPAGNAGVSVTVPVSGAKVFTLPSTITPNAVTSFSTLSAFKAPSGSVVF